MITGEYKPDFLKNKAVINEKEAMKIFLRDKGYKIKKVLKFQTLDNSKVYYTRGLLGFAQEYDFSTTRYNNHKPCEVNFKVIATDNEKKLIRFPSPLHYHVDNDYRGIYIIINNKSLQKLQELNPQIEFRGDDNGNFIGKISAQLSNEFKLEEFFDSIVLKKNKNIKKLGDNQNGRK